MAPAAGADGVTMMGDAATIGAATIMDGVTMSGDAATIAPPARVRTSAPRPASPAPASCKAPSSAPSRTWRPSRRERRGVDHRADIYAFGMILSDMLLGRRTLPDGMSPVEALQQRIQQPPVSLRATDASLPEAVDALVLRCLQLDPADRFPTTDDLVATLERLDENGELIPIKKVVGLKVLASVVVLALALLGGNWWYAQRLIPTAAHEPVSVVIADFENRTSDSTFDGTLEQTLKRGLEGAGFINAYDRSRIRGTFGVQPPEKLTEVAARELAVKQGLGVVVSGSIANRGNGYDISAKAIQTITGNVIATANGRASSKDQVLGAITKLTTTVRKALGDKTSASDQMFAMTSLSATSLEVVHQYAAGIEASSNNKLEQAREIFLKTCS